MTAVFDNHGNCIVYHLSMLSHSVPAPEDHSRNRHAGDEGDHCRKHISACAVIQQRRACALACQDSVLHALKLLHADNKAYR